MSQEPSNENSIGNFISTAITQIRSALPSDAKVDGIIHFEISTVLQQDTSGKFDIKILNFGVDASQNQIQKISIPIRLLYEAEKIEDEARIARAQREKAQAEYVQRKFH